MISRAGSSSAVACLDMFYSSAPYPPKEGRAKSPGVSLWITPWQTRTHCCGHIVADTNVSPFARADNICCGHKFCVRDTKNVSDFFQKHFVSATNVSQFAQPKKHHGQQCVCNNVSSFTRALSISLVHDFEKSRFK